MEDRAAGSVEPAVGGKKNAVAAIAIAAGGGGGGGVADARSKPGLWRDMVEWAVWWTCQGQRIGERM